MAHHRKTRTRPRRSRRGSQQGRDRGMFLAEGGHAITDGGDAVDWAQTKAPPGLQQGSLQGELGRNGGLPRLPEDRQLKGGAPPGGCRDGDDRGTKMWWWVGCLPSWWLRRL